MQKKMCCQKFDVCYQGPDLQCLQKVKSALSLRWENSTHENRHSKRTEIKNVGFMYRILTEFKVFMYWKDPPRANRDAEPRSGEALRFVRAGLSST